MKPRLQTSLGQQLVMTPQLRQAIRLLQMSTAELEVEITEAVETNPLLDWDDSVPNTDDIAAVDTPPDDPRQSDNGSEGEDWSPDEAPWSMDGVSHGSGGSFDDDDQGTAAERVAAVDSLQDHLLWQLHLSHLSTRDRRIGAALIDALHDDGYLREPLSGIAETLLPEVVADEEEILTVLHQLQRFDPVGVGARTLGECLHLQLAVLSEDTPGRALALQIVDSDALERLPKSGVAGLAAELKRAVAEVEEVVQLLRSLDPKPGAQIGEL
ncbi:MAG: RNA polymerase factor sigma-54, partial [Pseudoxanthomonas sp.]